MKRALLTLAALALTVAPPALAVPKAPAHPRPVAAHVQPAVPAPPAYRPAVCQSLIFNASVIDGHAVKSPWAPAEYAALFQAALEAHWNQAPHGSTQLAPSDVLESAADVLTGCLGIPVRTGN